MIIGLNRLNRVERTLQTHHVVSTLKRRENDLFHVVSTWNPRGVFVGNYHQIRTVQRRTNRVLKN